MWPGHVLQGWIKPANTMHLCEWLLLVQYEFFKLYRHDWNLHAVSTRPVLRRQRIAAYAVHLCRRLRVGFRSIVCVCGRERIMRSMWRGLGLRGRCSIICSVHLRGWICIYIQYVDGVFRYRGVLLAMWGRDVLFWWLRFAHSVHVPGGVCLVGSDCNCLFWDNWQLRGL